MPEKEQNAHGLVNECILKIFMSNKASYKNMNVLFPCGDLSINNIPKILTQVTIKCKNFIVYK